MRGGFEQPVPYGNSQPRGRWENHVGRIDPGSIELTQTLEQVSCSLHCIPVAS